MTGFGRTGPTFRLSTRIRLAGFDGACQRNDRRLSADGRHAGHADEFSTPFWAATTSSRPSSTATVTPANQLGAAASLASLACWNRLPRSARGGTPGSIGAALCSHSWSLPNVGDIRQVGLMAGVELVRNWKTREPFPLREQAGIRVCEAMARRGVLTRPVGNVIVLMPPYCTTPAQAQTHHFRAARQRERSLRRLTAAGQPYRLIFNRRNGFDRWRVGVGIDVLGILLSSFSSRLPWRGVRRREPFGLPWPRCGLPLPGEFPVRPA